MEKRKHISPQQKVIILREHLENQVPLSQLSERYQVHVNSPRRINLLYKFLEEVSMREEYHVELTIQKALEKFPGNNPRIISNNGSQFISGDFRKFLREVGLDHVRTSVRYPQSNGKLERFHRTIKDECLSRQSLIDLEDARRQVAMYIENYNTKRLPT